MPIRGNSDSDEDDTFFYRYPSAPQPPSLPQSASSSANNLRKTSHSRGSGGLAPSKSTLYISNLDFSLTNSDLHVLLSHFGPIARVTVLKDPLTRASRGVAFVQFVSASDAHKAAGELEGKILNGRKIRASIAKDNGRASEFIRKRVYKDKSRCYECGEDGHLSYECPKNVLGPRERPVPKKGRRGSGGGDGGGRGDTHYSEERDEQVFEEESWADAVDGGAEERLLRAEEEEEEEEESREKKEKRTSYFSDESEEDD